jgi:type VI protein secretion system component VasK
MQTIHQREAILLESKQQISREQLLRFPAKKTALPKARKWFEWRKVTRYAPAAVIVLVITGVLYYLHEANQNSLREMGKRIGTIAEQLQALESENQERYEELMTKLEDVRNELSQFQVPRVEREKVGAAFVSDHGVNSFKINGLIS